MDFVLKLLDILTVFLIWCFIFRLFVLFFFYNLVMIKTLEVFTPNESLWFHWILNLLQNSHLLYAMLSRPLKFKYISTSFAYIRIAIQCDSYSQLLENYCAQAQKKTSQHISRLSRTYWQMTDVHALKRSETLKKCYFYSKKACRPQPHYMECCYGYTAGKYHPLTLSKCFFGLSATLCAHILKA